MSTLETELEFAKARIEALEELASHYYTMLRVVHEKHWEESMTPFWNGQRKKAQARAEELGVRYGRKTSQ